MEDTERDKSELNSRSFEYVDPRQTEFGYPGNGCGSGSAKYKLLSPAKLPISRSPGITNPPGFSPTSFLESPVLLSNMKCCRPSMKKKLNVLLRVWGEFVSFRYSFTT